MLSVDFKKYAGFITISGDANRFTRWITGDRIWTGWSLHFFVKKELSYKENIDKVNKAVGFAGGQKEAEHRTQLAESFQTNGTQSINPKHFKTLEKFQLVIYIH